VAIDSLYPQHLPRTRAQLQRTLASVDAADAYARKMSGNGFPPRSAAEPMRDAVLNDELYAAHWARRELSGRSDADGFDVTLYDDAPHFDSVRTQDAIDEFERGESIPSRGYDALLLRGRRLSDRQPDEVFAGGQEPPLYLYLRATREATLR